MLIPDVLLLFEAHLQTQRKRGVLGKVLRRVLSPRNPRSSEILQSCQDCTDPTSPEPSLCRRLPSSIAARSLFPLPLQTTTKEGFDQKRKVVQTSLSIKWNIAIKSVVSKSSGTLHSYQGCTDPTSPDTSLRRPASSRRPLMTICSPRPLPLPLQTQQKEVFEKRKVVQTIIVNQDRVEYCNQMCCQGYWPDPWRRRWRFTNYRLLRLTDLSRAHAAILRTAADTKHIAGVVDTESMEAKLSGSNGSPRKSAAKIAGSMSSEWMYWPDFSPSWRRVFLDPPPNQHTSPSSYPNALTHPAQSRKNKMKSEYKDLCPHVGDLRRDMDRKERSGILPDLTAQHIFFRKKTHRQMTIIEWNSDRW